MRPSQLISAALVAIVADARPTQRVPAAVSVQARSARRKRRLTPFSSVESFSPEAACASALNEPSWAQ